MKPGDLFVSGDRHEPTALFVVVGAYDPAREQWPVVRITWDGRGPETGFWNVTTNFLDLSPAPLPEDVGFVKVSEGHPNVWDRVRIR